MSTVHWVASRMASATSGRMIPPDSRVAVVWALMTVGTPSRS